MLVGGHVTSHKGVNLPGVPLPIPSLTRKDMDDLDWALETGVDFVALSFVRSPADVRDLRALLEQAGSHAHVIAKIEKAEAVDVLDEILAETDVVMVARGDLGVEIGPAVVPLVQKRIIHRALELGKTVITATQMLETMVHSPEPTRAEASDVANAILDGTSAVMLSGETAVGEYPVEAVAYMDRIARAVEPSLDYRHEIPDAADDPTIGQAMSNAACDLAEALQAKAILVPTFSGRTASAVARLRPRRPIVALTHVDWAMRQLALEWGVTPVLITETRRRRGSLAARDRRRARGGHRRVRRPRRHHRRHRGEHPRLDERHQGRHRVGGKRQAPEKSRSYGFRKSRRGVRLLVGRRWFAVAVLVLVGLLYYRPLHDYFASRAQRARARRRGQEARARASGSRAEAAGGVVAGGAGRAGATPRLHPSRRAPLHRQEHPAVAAQAECLAPWPLTLTGTSSHVSSGVSRAPSIASPFAARSARRR